MSIWVRLQWTNAWHIGLLADDMCALYLAGGRTFSLMSLYDSSSTCNFVHCHKCISLIYFCDSQCIYGGYISFTSGCALALASSLALIYAPVSSLWIRRAWKQEDTVRKFLLEPPKSKRGLPSRPVTGNAVSIRLNLEPSVIAEWFKT